jgi:hypothetical protein
VLAPRDAKREFGERRDAVSVKRVDSARRQPAGNVVSDRRYRHSCDPKGLNAFGNKPCVFDAFSRAVIEEFGKVVAMASPGKSLFRPDNWGHIKGSCVSISTSLA